MKYHQLIRNVVKIMVRFLGDVLIVYQKMKCHAVMQIMELGWTLVDGLFVVEGLQMLGILQLITISVMIILYGALLHGMDHPVTVV